MPSRVQAAAELSNGSLMRDTSTNSMSSRTVAINVSQIVSDRASVPTDFHIRCSRDLTRRNIVAIFSFGPLLFRSSHKRPVLRVRARLEDFDKNQNSNIFNRVSTPRFAMDLLSLTINGSRLLIVARYARTLESTKNRFYVH